MRSSLLRVAGAASMLLQAATAVQVTVTDPASVKSAASTVAFGLLKYYTGNNTGDVPGNLPAPYFWWEAGAMFGTLVDYWFLTGDETYNNITTQAMLHQVGDSKDYMPENQTRTEGNDDQGFWALAAMSAAENNFPNPPSDQPQWLALAQAVFNEYVSRWDTQHCNGGLRWQIFPFNNGFNYKNSISNGCFFNIAARLARYTGNKTYSDWAEKVYDWETQVGFITSDFRVLDGASVDGTQNCTKPVQLQWSYNSGIFMHGAAVMYNVSGASPTWKKRLDGLWGQAKKNFFNGSIMVEQPCETVNLCDNDQQSFKGYLARWMAGTTQMAPYTFGDIMPLLQKNAQAAAAACSGSPASGYNGPPGTACGFKWNNPGGPAFDGLVGVGQQMNALSALMYTLVAKVAGPVTATTGGTSVGNPNAGIPQQNMRQLTPITTGDRVAAGFLTTAIVMSVIGGGVFILK